MFDLEEAELCYAPQYGAAKDPVNVAGMIAANVIRGDVRLAPWSELHTTDALLLWMFGSRPNSRKDLSMER